jgi:hypothetical protein
LGLILQPFRRITQAYDSLPYWPQFQTASHSFKARTLAATWGISDTTRSSGIYLPRPRQSFQDPQAHFESLGRPIFYFSKSFSCITHPLFRTLPTLRVLHHQRICHFWPCSSCPKCRVVEVQTAQLRWRTMSPGRKVCGIPSQSMYNILTAL